MAITRRSTTSSTRQKIQEKQEDDNDNNGTKEEIDEEKEKEENEEEKEPQSPYTPQTITLKTFTHLLGLYPQTVEAVMRGRVISGGGRGGKKKKKMMMMKEEQKSSKEEQEEEEKQQDYLIECIMEERLKLNHWRYEGVGVDGSGWMDDDGDVDLDEDPEDEEVQQRVKTVKEKQGQKETKKKTGLDGRCLTKNDVVRLMEWKLQHGVYRPALLGMIKSNPEKTVEQATRAAFSALPGENTPHDRQQQPSPGKQHTGLDEEFPSTSLTELTTPLRGVGIATASLILSAVTAHGNKGGGVPFFSDDVYLWLCMGEVPRLRGELARESAERMRRRKACYKRLGGELALKYNVKEYRELWEAVRDLRRRLLLDIKHGENGEEKEELVSCTNVEKVAFVLRHVEVSGFGEDLVSVDRACLGIVEKSEGVEKKRELVEEESIKEEVGGKKKRSKKG